MSIFPGENKRNVMLLSWNFFLVNDFNSSLTIGLCFNQENQQNVNGNIVLNSTFFYKVDINGHLIDQPGTNL